MPLWKKTTVSFGKPSFNNFAALIIILSLSLGACKQDADKTAIPSQADAKSTASVSAQPLPGGKQNYSVALGRLITNGTVWVMMVNWTFNASAGTVASTYWTWSTALQKGKAVIHPHSCTLDGVTKTCGNYTPAGWILPAGQHVSRTGTYTYNTTTNVLTITWDATKSETWQISNPITTLARADFISSTGTGYSITHGYGFGSNASWSTFKTLANVPKISYPGRIATAELFAGVRSVGTKTSTFNLSSFSPSPTTNPTNLHWYQTDYSSSCEGDDPGDGNDRPGNVYHLSSDNTNRAMVYSSFCATLPVPSEWPCYTGGRHPWALMQVIDDNGVLKGFVGIEQQNVSTSPNWTYRVLYQVAL